MRILLVLIAVLGTFGVGYGLAGALDRSADTVGMLRPLFAALILIGAVAARGTGMRLFLGVFGITTLFSVLIFLLPHAAGSDLRVYAKNLWYGNDQVSALETDIRAADVDVVALQEISGRNSELLDALRDTFPHQHVCRFSGRFGMAILSRTPFAQDGICSSRRALAAAQITKDGRNVWIVSTHIPWPYPFENEAAENAATDLLTSLEGPVVVAGDFNVFPWSGRLQRIRSLTKTVFAGPLRPTHMLYGTYPMAIDHVLAPGGGSVRYRPLLGSDHRGLVANVDF